MHPESPLDHARWVYTQHISLRSIHFGRLNLHILRWACWTLLQDIRRLVRLLHRRQRQIRSQRAVRERSCWGRSLP